jgi:hypothetical protein
MKRFTTLALIITLYSFSLTQYASAQLATVCVNCSTIFAQLPQWAQEIITAGASLSTQANTYLLQYKVTVLDPLGNAMIAVSLIKQQSNTINLVTGALGGSQPLLKSDPEKWVKDQGLNVVQVSLSDLSQQKGTYSDSLFGSLVSNFKAQNNPLQTTLQNLGGSSIPSTVQNNLCSDATLTQTAKNDVTGTDGNFDPAELTARKKQLYDSLCTCNPSTDQQCAQKLTQVNNQRPDIGGWNTWLAVTNGDNAYTKNVQATIVVSNAADAAKTAAASDLNRGGGVASPRVCDPSKKVSTAANGDPVLNIADALCRGFTITNTGSAVNASFQSALNAPLQRLVSSFGDGIIGTLSSLLSARNTVNMLSNAFGSASSGGSQDPAADSAGKSTITSPELARLSTYSASLDSLEQADTSLLSEISIAEGNADQVRSCFQGLVDDFNLDPGSSQVSSGFSYYQSQMLKLAGLRSTVSQDQDAITAARTAITDLQNLLASSSSTEEISAAVTAFEEKVNNGTLPSASAGSLRQADYITLKGDNQVTTMQGGNTYNLKNQCASTRQQLTPRDGA